MKDGDRIVKTNEENCHNTLEERLAEQDRISFGAGLREGARVGFGAGIREVVEWIDNQYDGSEDMWQAKLKEWGIE